MYKRQIRNVAIGRQSGVNVDDNDLPGGVDLTTGDNNVYIGAHTQPSGANVANEIVIGYATTGKGINTVTLGNSSVTDIYLSEDQGAFLRGAGMKIADESALTLGNSNLDAYVKVTASATAANEDIRIVNTNGTDEAAITLTSSAGGIMVDAAASKDIDIQGGQLKLVSKDNTASAISLTTDIGSSETIVITNTQGTSSSAVDINATAGGVTIDASSGLSFDGTDNSNFTVTANSASNKTMTISASNSGSGDSNIDMDADGDITIDGSSVSIDASAASNLTTSSGALTLDGAGGVNVGTSTSGVAVSIGHTTSETTVNDNLTVTGNVSGSGTISGFDANLNAATISSNNYTLVASDNGKVVTIDNSTTAATVSIPANLGDGFNCLVVQKGNHQTTIQIVSGSGVTIANRSSETKTAGQYAVISIINIGSETYILSGDTAN